MRRPLKIRWIACLLALALGVSMLSGCTVANMQGSGTKGKVVPEAETEEEDTASKELDVEVKESEKYQINGTDAFYILPTGSDLSEAMLNFRLLDLIDGEITIYVYQCLYGLEDSSGRGGMPATGTAVRSDSSQVNSQALTGNTDLATVIMMYNTKTQAYQVIHSWTDKVTVTDTRDENGVAHRNVTFRGGSRAVQVEDSLTTIFAQKFITRDSDNNLRNSYYMYAGGVGYFWHYDSDKKTCYFDTASNIRSALSLAIADAIKDTGKEESEVTTSILQATADSAFDQYFSLYLTWDNESSGDLSNMSDEELEKLEGTGANSGSARYITCCFGINFDSSTDDSKRFYGDSLVRLTTATSDEWVNYEDLSKKWMSIDGQTISESEANAEDFLTAEDIAKLYKDNLYRSTTFTYNANNYYTVVLKNSVSADAHEWAAQHTNTNLEKDMSSTERFAAGIDMYHELEGMEAAFIWKDGATSGANWTLAADISYESQDSKSRFFIFPVADTKILDITADTVELTRSYKVSVPVEDDDAEDTDESGDTEESAADSEATEDAAVTGEAAENAETAEEAESSGSSTGTKVKYRLDERTETATFVKGYYLRLQQPTAATWYTNEVTSDGIVPSMGSGYLRYYSKDKKLSVGKCSGTKQSNSTEYHDTEFEGVLDRGIFVPPSANKISTGNSYMLFFTDKQIRVLQCSDAKNYLEAKNVSWNGSWSVSNSYLNFNRNNKEGRDTSLQDIKAEDVDKVEGWSESKKDEVRSKIEEYEKSADENQLNLYKNMVKSAIAEETAEKGQEMLDTLNTESVDLIQGSNGHLWLLSAGVNSGLVLTDLYAAKAKDSADATEDLSSVQLSDMYCYGVYADANGKELDIIGYDTQEYGYSTADIYRAKLYHRSLFDQKMCYNMVMSLAKKYPTVYESILSDGNALLSRLSKQWSLGSYQADLSLAKQYVQYKRLVETGSTTGKTLFCRLSGLQESDMTELNLAKLLDCYDQKAVENLILELCPDLKEEAEAKESSTESGSGIKISKETTAAVKATVPESTAASAESSSVSTKDGESAESTEEITISVDVEQSYQDAETRFKLRSLRCAALGIETSEWDALVTEMIDDLHPAASLNAYIREQLYKYFARMGNLSYTSDMQAEIRRCESWEDAEKLIGYYRMSDKDKIALNMLKATTELSDEQKLRLTELEAKRQDCIEEAKQDAVKNLYDAYDSQSLLASVYGNSWNEQWQEYWKKMLTRVVEAAKS